jgi:hypothetical protein
MSPRMLPNGIMRFLKLQLPDGIRSGNIGDKHDGITATYQEFAPSLRPQGFIFSDSK